jgi:hypothetical protein
VIFSVKIDRSVGWFIHIVEFPDPVEGSVKGRFMGFVSKGCLDVGIRNKTAVSWLFVFSQDRGIFPVVAGIHWGRIVRTA